MPDHIYSYILFFSNFTYTKLQFNCNYCYQFCHYLISKRTWETDLFVIWPYSSQLDSVYNKHTVYVCSSHSRVDWMLMAVYQKNRALEQKNLQPIRISEFNAFIEYDALYVYPEARVYHSKIL